MGHKKKNCREWLKLTQEEQEKADKEKPEEKPQKYLQHIRCYNCNKMGHLTKDCPEKKTKDSSGGSGGGFVIMCVEGGVEEDTEQLNLEATSEAGLEEKNSEVHPEAKLEQSFSLQDWINSEIQSPLTENQSYMNAV